MDQLEDTLRLPAKGYTSSDQKQSRNRIATDVQHMTQPPPDQDEDNGDLDTLPLGKVTWPIAEDEIDTLRLPARRRSTVAQKASRSSNNVGEQHVTRPASDRNEVGHFLVLDTNPMGKVTSPVTEDQIDMLRSPAVVPVAVDQKTTTAWINADGRRVILARTLRMFGYGFISVLIGVTLAQAGLSFIQVSLLLTTALVGAVVAVIFVAVFADRLGRRRILVFFALLMVLAGLAFTFSHNLIILLLAAFFGTISPSSTSENTAFVAIEQAILPQTCVQERCTDAFTRYNLAAQLAGAVGGLAVALPDILYRFTGLATDDGAHAMFALYALLGMVVAVLFMGMTEKVEPALRMEGSSIARLPKPLQESRQIVLRLAGLFTLDAFAGGLMVQTILAFWFQQRFGISLSALGVLFFGTNLLAALSLPIAARLSKRFGLLKTMVFTHLPSQLLLVLVPLMPTFWLAACFLLCRQSLSKMDVPTRQAYLMGLVVPEERTAAAGFTTMARSIATSISPLVAGVLLTDSSLVLGLPFLLAGSLSMLYDLLLYGLFRNMPSSTDH